MSAAAKQVPPKRRKTPKTQVNPAQKIALLSNGLNWVRLVWGLLCDKRVRRWPKVLFAVVVIYVLSPIDLIPDFIVGLGQLDDITLVVAAIAILHNIAPKAVVDEWHQKIWPSG